MLKESFKPIQNLTLTVLSTFILVGILWILLVLYGNLSVGKALFASTIYGIFLTACVLFYRLIEQFTNSFPRKIMIFLLLQILLLVITFLICWLFNIILPKQFVMLTPLLLIFGLLIFGLFIGWGTNFAREDEDKIEKNMDYSIPEKQEIIEENNIKLERITVKQGSEIHILKTEEIYYFESYGDYVLIFSESEKYMKEKTMRYFETNLPVKFVRIHRSHIVNTDYMIRLELFGKENYYIRLKNGVNLKVSKAGYKLLKERLDL